MAYRRYGNRRPMRGRRGRPRGRYGRRGFAGRRRPAPRIGYRM